MEILIEAYTYIIENFIEIAVGFGTILAVIKTRGKTLDEIKKNKEKQLEKLKAKNDKTKKRLTDGLKREAELEKEIAK